MAKLNLVAMSSAVRGVLADAHAPVQETGDSAVDGALKTLSIRLRAGQPIAERGPIANIWDGAPPQIVAIWDGAPPQAVPAR